MRNELELPPRRPRPRIAAATPRSWASGTLVVSVKPSFPTSAYIANSAYPDLGYTVYNAAHEREVNAFRSFNEICHKAGELEAASCKLQAARLRSIARGEGVGRDGVHGSAGIASPLPAVDGSQRGGGGRDGRDGARRGWRAGRGARARRGCFASPCGRWLATRGRAGRVHGRTGIASPLPAVDGSQRGVWVSGLRKRAGLRGWGAQRIDALP